MPQIGDQVQTSTLAFADHGAEIASCNCDGCDHACWDSDRDPPRDFSKTQCFDQCVTESKCRLYEHVPEDGIGKAKGNVTTTGSVHQTCYRKTTAGPTLPPTTLAPTNAAS